MGAGIERSEWVQELFKTVCVRLRTCARGCEVAHCRRICRFAAVFTTFDLRIMQSFEFFGVYVPHRNDSGDWNDLHPS